MFLLIDGYNLMHAAGIIGRQVAQNQLAGARKRLLDWLASASHGKGASLRVVFDAQQAPAASKDEIYRGLEVSYAFQQTADDAIEAELAGRARGSVVVVSNDTRLHESARRRGCEHWSCEHFQDWLLSTPMVLPAPIPVDDKPRQSQPFDADLLAAFNVPKPKPKRK